MTIQNVLLLKENLFYFREQRNKLVGKSKGKTLQYVLCFQSLAWWFFNQPGIQLKSIARLKKLSKC